MPDGFAFFRLFIHPWIDRTNREPDLTVPSTPWLDSSGSDGVDLVHEDDGGRMLSSHHEQLSHHATALA